MTDTMIRVLLADDHEIVRLGLRAVLEDANDIEVVGEVSTAEAAIAALRLGELMSSLWTYVLARVRKAHLYQQVLTPPQRLNAP